MKAIKEEHLAILRRHMVDVIGIHADLCSPEIGKSKLSERVLAAFREVPRHLFVPEPLASIAYEDRPLPIGFQKTISQPFIVALMVDLLEPKPGDKVLEVGTGLGYQTAILARLTGHVWSVEIVEEFAAEAEARLRQVKTHNTTIRVGDGSRGWSDHAPYDKVVVAAAARHVPTSLMEQLRPGGRLVMPLGSRQLQQLTVIDKNAAGEIQSRGLIGVLFSELETVA